MADEPSEFTSPSLIAGAQASDPVAWQRLVKLYSPLMFSWCRRAGLSAHDAGDLLQDAWAAVSANLVRFDHQGPGATFRGWLYTIVRNKVRDFHRRGESIQGEGGTEAQQRWQELPDREAEESRADPQTGETALLRRAVSEIRGEFEERTFRMFWQTNVEGRPAGDVASEMGVTTDAVYQAKSRVARRLRAVYEKILEF